MVQVREGSVADDATEHIRAQILDGTLRRGSKLPGERQLSVDLGISRTALRDALRTLEARVVAGKYSAELLLPSRQTWRIFAEQFEHAMLAIHAIAPLRFVIKPDEETKGGPWHRWSMTQASDVAIWALRPGKPSPVLAWLALTTLESLDAGHLARIAPPARLAWLKLLDKLRQAGPRNLRDDCQDFTVALLFSFKKRERPAVIATLSKPMQVAIANQLATG